MIAWESSEERINENYYTQRHSNFSINNMDNAKKNYVNMERLSSGDIFVLLDSIESDDEEDIENIMNDSNTDFCS